MRKKATSPYRTPHHLPVIGLFLLIALMTPMLTLEVASATQGDESQCEPGLVLDEQTGECVAEPGEPQQSACAEGEILDPATNQCVPEQPACADGEVLDPVTGQCVPQQPACAEGELLDPATGQCVPQQPSCAEGELLDPNTGECFSAPAGARQRGSESLPICGEGEALDHVTLTCVPQQETPPECVDGEFLDTIANTCLPPASFALHKFWCPGTFDADQAALEALQTTCSNNNAMNISWTFRVAPRAGIDSGEEVTGTYGSTSYGSEHLPPGQLTVTELPTDGYGTPVVFCDRPQGTATRSGAFTRWSVSDDASIGAELQPGDGLTCYWFSVPLTIGPARIVIESHWCPAGLDAAEVSLADLTEACREAGSGATFSLTGGEQDWPAQSPQGGPPPSVTWDNLPPEHEYTITESGVSTLLSPVIFCHESANLPVKVDAGNGSVTWTATPGATWTCAWFHLADDDTAGKALIVQKYTCPDGSPAHKVVPDPQGDCAPMADVAFSATYGGSTSTGSTDADGVVRWDGVPDGPWSIQETIPDGYGEPSVVCGHVGQSTLGIMQVTDGRIEGTLEADENDEYCIWYNEPVDTTSVFVEKFNCPEGATPDETYESYLALCTEPAEAVEFTLSTALDSPSRSTNDFGRVEWSLEVPVGPFTLTETVPPGYGVPVWWCASEFGTGFDPVYTGASIEILNDEGGEYYCFVFNFPEDPGEVTIHKWTCPAGYAPIAHDADPTIDCAEATDGVVFTLDQQEGVHLQGTTGDAIPGAVYFGGLPPGAYTVTETVPQGIASQFVWDCVGTGIDSVHPAPLSTGAVLAIDIAAGDAITCNWYNVPRSEHGSVTVTKYACWTPAFTSEVDCQVHEGGASFELLASDGTTSVGVGTTGPEGTYSWDGLETGSYTLRELDGVPCHLANANGAGAGHVTVVAGETTSVSVYNCDVEPAGEAPIQYPNTGAAPTGAMQGEASSPATPEAGVSSASFHDITCLDAPVTPGGTPPPNEPTATPRGNPACLRGAVPSRLVIPDADIDASVEVIEIVNGIMQEPTGSDTAGWYKETPRLGEPGNMLVAGHLNWWNVPEGVFYHLAEMEAGDRIEITGDDGLIYVYEVRWLRQESSLAPPAADVIGPTDEPSLTLITCGGDWNADLATYDERTVVRAVQVDVQPAEAAAGG